MDAGDIVIILFVVFLLTLLAEFILSITWVPAYYRSGITLFRKEFRTYSEVEVNTGMLENEMEKGAFAPMVFENISPTEYAFREKKVYFKILSFNYPPVMNGHIVVEGSRIIVIGRLRWSVVALVAFLASIPSTTANIAPFAIFMMMCLLVFSIPLFIQFRRFNKIARLLAESNGAVIMN